jgi:hypothetical protein
MNDKKEFNRILQQLHGSLMRHPAAATILEDLENGDITDDDAMLKLVQWGHENPEAAAALEKEGDQAFGPYRGSSNAAKLVPTTDQKLPSIADMWEFREDKLPRLNPLFEAALTERLQFDGDIPELRTGTMPDGATPSVPVATDARDPVVVGRMLKDASEQVAEQVEKKKAHLAKSLQKALMNSPTPVDENGAALVATGDKTLALLSDSSFDPEGYKRGEIPKALTIEEPNGQALSNLTLQEKQDAAWLTISTTQGRRTAKPILEILIQTALEKRGVNISIGTFDPSRKPVVLAHEEWTMSLDGPKATQPGFAVFDTAAKVLTASLFKQLKGTKKEVALQVVLINNVDVRSVGWAARCVEKTKGG